MAGQAVRLGQTHMAIIHNGLTSPWIIIHHTQCRFSGFFFFFFWHFLHFWLSVFTQNCFLHHIFHPPAKKALQHKILSAFTQDQGFSAAQEFCSISNYGSLPFFILIHQNISLFIAFAEPCNLIITENPLVLCRICHTLLTFNLCWQFPV